MNGFGFKGYLSQMYPILQGREVFARINDDWKKPHQSRQAFYVVGKLCYISDIDSSNCVHMILGFPYIYRDQHMISKCACRAKFYIYPKVCELTLGATYAFLVYLSRDVLELCDSQVYHVNKHEWITVT